MPRRVRLKSFRKVRKKLAALNINWDPRRGKGSHGCFIGPHRQTGKLNAFPIPRSQQQQINIDYLKTLRRHFGLEAKQWDQLFDDC